MCLDICREETTRRCRCSRDIIWKQPLHVQTKPLIQKQPLKLILIQVELNILLLTILIKQFISNDEQFFFKLNLWQNIRLWFLKLVVPHQSCKWMMSLSCVCWWLIVAGCRCVDHESVNICSQLSMRHMTVTHLESLGVTLVSLYLLWSWPLLSTPHSSSLTQLLHHLHHSSLSAPQCQQISVVCLCCQCSLCCLTPTDQYHCQLQPPHARSAVSSTSLHH